MQSNGLVPTKDAPGTPRGLDDAFSALDSLTELVITADDIEVFEFIPDDTPWFDVGGAGG